MITIPFENVHSAKLKDSEGYKKVVTKDLGDGIQLLLGIKDEKDESASEPLSYHFDKEKWTPKKVKAWLKEHDIKPTELAMAKKEDQNAKENSGPEVGNDTPLGVNSGTTDIKENMIVTHNGDSIPEQVPIDRVPEKLFGNIRQQDVPELIDKVHEVEISEVLEKEPESVMEEAQEDLMENISDPEESLVEPGLELPPYDPEQARQGLIEWAKSEDGTISKKSLMKWFLDIDAGSGQDESSYRYPVGYVEEGEPHYCQRSLDYSWNLASGRDTGIANRNIQKKIIFIKQREDIPLTEDQLEFTERHMSKESIKDEHVLEDDNSPGGMEIIPQMELKLNSSIAGSKVIFEDDNVIDVPVIPMREGVFTGTDGIATLKEYKYFGKDAHWLEGQPILKGHTGPTELVTYKHNRIGKLMNVTARPDKKDVVAVARYYKEKLTPEDLTRIKSGTPYDGSIAYTTHTSITSGDHNGTKYNAIEDGGYHFYHFAELAKGIGACSTKDGCGFMLNESGVPEIIKTYFNEKRRAEITKVGDSYQIKLNSTKGGSGLLETTEEDTVHEWGQIYVKSGKIPISMKLNYNCPDSEKSGSGAGSCGGADKGSESKDKGSKPKVAFVKEGPETAMTIVGGKPKTAAENKALTDQMATFVDKGPDKKMEVIPPKSSHLTINDSDHPADIRNSVVKYLKDAGKDKDADAFEKAFEDIAVGNIKLGKKETFSGKIIEIASKYGVSVVNNRNKKLNSRFSNNKDLQDINMTEEEYIQPEESPEPTFDVQKLNESFEAKLNERDTKISELETQLADLVQKQNAAEQAQVDKKAKEDFEAFTLKLNAKSRQDAQVHYEGFKSNGWAYFDEHPGVLRLEVPKMNARGTPAGEGDNASALQQAREMLHKTQKETVGKRLR